MNGNARLADIAAQAGVSEATVSRVLNGRSGVSANTRRLVLTALDLMGYERPQRLRQRSNGLIGLVTPELDNPIFPAFAQAVERSLTQHGYTPVLCTQSPGGAPEDEFTELLLERDVSGIVYVSGLHADTTARMDRYTRLVDRGLPIVLIDGYSERVEAPFISPDDRLAARLAVRHLVDLGHRRIGLAVGQRRFVPVIRKIEGFAAALADLLGVADCEPFVRHSLFSVEGGQAAASALIEAGCTAIVCASDLMALGAIRAARDRGLSVPGEVSVVGFDDSPLIPFTDPPLTTIRKPIGPMAVAAVQTLLEGIAGAPPKNLELVFQPELIVRRSTAPAPR
ncbi:HTH-type transcriptional regulator MalR [Sphaerisporangium krabiense]|uniref:DNA-binding LacI/PurR family transcriptional regulator n=1 Tax=Sphaerisporangium krabiense TaxID=763782 RepID=A0A7W8Z987_9ACTN|nr:LacI family DNA-binding transcriptional regulator [Sphaerisporangium krabiense]MBB5629748.1 DNA-binding LacI/PurR family transcriptional regulator [Sphaerisporangium krabiense]GII63848.1 HTH-type transcriptional regulator MalR [Sphaerisporangium krabiense]